MASFILDNLPNSSYKTLLLMSDICCAYGHVSLRDSPGTFLNLSLYPYRIEGRDFPVCARYSSIQIMLGMLLLQNIPIIWEFIECFERYSIQLVALWYEWSFFPVLLLARRGYGKVTVVINVLFDFLKYWRFIHLTSNYLALPISQVPRYCRCKEEKQWGPLEGRQ